MKNSKWYIKYKSLPIQVRASFWFLICAFMQKGISVITTPIFTRLLTTAEYGEFNVFNSWLSIVSVFVTLNLYCGVYTQGLIKFENRRKEYSSTLQGLVFTLVLSWTAIYLLFHDFWNRILSLTTVQVLAMLVIMWTTAAFTFWSIEQRVDFKYQKLVLVTIIVSIVKPFVGVLCVIFAEDKVTARILGIALVELVAYSGFFFVQMFRGKKFFSAKYWRYALAFNLPLIPHYLSQSVLSGIDRIMISKMVSVDAAGIYSLAYSISMLMTIFNGALMQTIEPWLYRKIKEDKAEEMKKVAYPTFFLIACINIMLIAIAPEIVRLFAPVEYYDAIWIIPPATMSVYFMFTYTYFAVFEFYYEKTKYITIATLIGAVLNVILNYIFIQIFGYYAAGYTTLVCYMFYSLFHYIFMKKLSREKMPGKKIYDTKILLLITSGFLILGFLLLFTYTNTILRYSLIGVIIFIILWKYKVLLKLVQDILKIRGEKK